MTLDETEKLNLSSLDFTEKLKMEILRLFPQVHTESGNIDFDKLKLILGEAVETGKERYGMNWPGKAECFKLVQIPSLGTLRPNRKESINFDNTENLIIEGDNLEVLKLLQKAYLGKIKMIYIDPPYNTGNDFIYPDNYTECLQTYLEYTGQVDAAGKKFNTNTEADGRFHSNWLNMMYPRLYLARNLLRNDGAIFISIDDHEVDNLRKICNEIFGEENFIAQVIWQKKYSPQNDDKHLSELHEYIIVYSRNADIWRPTLLPRTAEGLARYQNPDNDPRGPWKAGDFSSKTKASGHSYPIMSPSGKIFLPPPGRQWAPAKDTYEKLLTDNRIWFGPSGNNAPALKQFLSEVQSGTVPTTLWMRELVGDNQKANREIAELGIPYDSPKPVGLILHALKIGTTSDNDLIMDFFAGSGTTGQAVLKLNEQDNGKRRFILVQLPEPLDPSNKNQKPGADFCDSLHVPRNIAEITKERVRRAIKKLNDKSNGKLELDALQGKDHGFRNFKLTESNFKAWNAEVSRDANALTKQLELHIDHVLHGRTSEDILYEILIKSGFTLATAVEKLVLAGKEVYSAAEGALLICLENAITIELVRAIAERKPERVVCLDAGFVGNDQLKANAVQIFRTKGVTSFKTV